MFLGLTFDRNLSFSSYMYFLCTKFYFPYKVLHSGFCILSLGGSRFRNYVTFPCLILSYAFLGGSLL